MIIGGNMTKDQNDKKVNMTPLEVKGLMKSFREKKVLDNISLTINREEIYGLVGLNGIGKTTLIKSIVGLLRPDEGEIAIFGHENNTLAAKKHIAYLPEKMIPSPFLKGHEYLSLTLGYYNKAYDEKKAEAVCVELDLDPAALNRRVGNYSKGMGQKLGLAATFLTESAILILDEPMSGLDPRARISLKRKLRSYIDNGRSIFFSSHILGDIEEICDRIGILHNGQIRYEGDVKGFTKSYPNKTLEEAFLISIEEGAKKKAAPKKKAV
jgi:ABC-2 type transport system ATP-binding protein